MLAETNTPPFDCSTCKQHKEHNCNNMFKLIDSCVQTDEIGLSGVPLWQQKDIKDKLPKSNRAFPECVFELGDFIFYECPVTWITPDTKRILKYLSFSDKPEKLFPGTWLEQPQWWIEAIEIFNSEKAKRKPPKLG